MSRSFVDGVLMIRRPSLHAAFVTQAGFFAREGIDLTVRTVFGGPEMSAAVESGEVHVGEVGTPPGLTAIGAGRRIRIVGSALGPRTGDVSHSAVRHPGVERFQGKRQSRPCRKAVVVTGNLGTSSCRTAWIRIGRSSFATSGPITDGSLSF